jgi:hypothetical protein
MLNNFWQWFLAYYRLDKKAICKMSIGKGLYDDYHDYKDDKDKYPFHFADLTCERCNKKFRI